MKRFTTLMTVAFMSLCFVAQAQVDFNDPRYAAWGADAQLREQNLLNNTYFKEALDNKLYDEAAALFVKLIVDCPKASEAIFARGIVLYKAKIARAKSMDEKKIMVDSLMFVHDKRLEYYANHAKRGRNYILDSKARDYFNFMKSDRAGLREVFKLAIEAGGQETDLKLVYLYFQNLCDDYKMDEVMADEVMAEFERLMPYFDNLEDGEAKLREDFVNVFSTSGVATCENLEVIYGKQLAENTEENVELLMKAVRLMTRLKCNSQFYVSTAETLYKLAPTSQSAMTLASIFQGQSEYDKAARYLRDALQVEEDMEQRELLNARIALIELAANRPSAAAIAARESINTPDGTKSDNGIGYFVLAQCYAAAAADCGGFEGQATYWAAYDVIALAIANLTGEGESEYRSIARQMQASYAAFFPSSEECFFREIKEGDPYTIKCGLATGLQTTVRVRK